MISLVFFLEVISFVLNIEILLSFHYETKHLSAVTWKWTMGLRRMLQ